jgi:hypothetical protein
MPAGDDELDNPRGWAPGEFRRRLLQQEKDAKQQKAFKGATRYFRPRKTERGGVVLIAATKTRSAKPGDRVPKNYKGKVYALYVSKTKKVTPYKEYTPPIVGKRRKAKTKHPVAIKSTTIDPLNFRTKAARRVAEKLFFVPGSKLIKPVTVTAKTGNVRWYEDVIPKTIRATKRMIKKAFGDKEIGDVPILFEVRAELELPDGSKITIDHVDSFGQRKEQKPEDSLYEGFLERRLYAGLAEKLSEKGLVSRGSARHVGALPENQGKPQSKWTRRDKPWYKRKYDVARVSSITIMPTVQKVTNKPQ